MPEAKLTFAVVWSNVETPLEQAKAALLDKIKQLETTMASGNVPAFYTAMMELKALANAPPALNEITCNIEHWFEGECVRRQVNIKKLVGENALGDISTAG